MKKILTITLLVLLTVGLFVSCDGNAEETVFKNMTKDSGLFKFVAEEDTTISLKKNEINSEINSVNKINLEYRKGTDSGWTAYTIDEGISLTAGEELYFRAPEGKPNTAFNKNYVQQSSTSYYAHYSFELTGKARVEGNIMYLLVSNGNSLTVPKDAFFMLFYNCEKLTSIDKLSLPATELADSCYSRMFYGCASLTDLPEKLLPAKKMEANCYDCMFYGCASLTDLPEKLLPATELAEYCYNSMFQDCTSLKNTPNLPATQLAPSCYYNMFCDCSKLNSACVLPAGTLKDKCYFQMFLGCSSLNSVTMLATNISADRCLAWWLDEAATTGTLYVANGMVDALDGDDYRPSGWDVVSSSSSITFDMQNLGTQVAAIMNVAPGSKITKPKDPTAVGYTFGGWYKESTYNTEWDFDTDTVTDGVTLYAKWTPVPFKFVAEEANASVKLVKTGSPNDISLEYSTDGVNFKDYAIGTGIPATNVGDEVYFRAKTSNANFSKYSSYYNFVLSNKMSCDGNIMYLLDSTGKLTTVPEYAFVSLFNGCTSLTTAPALPATTLAGYCYKDMFNGCTSLTTAPELPATTLADYCYYNMFNGCTSLTTAPELPATTLAASCYYNMFNGCTSLTTAPEELPATTLAMACYQYMFNGCTSLTTAPALPATTLAASCYAYMFNCCTSLTTAPALPATTLAMACYLYMFNGCTSLTTAPALPATTLADSCYYAMFNGCTSLTTAPALPATTLAGSCYLQMFNGCTSLTTAPALPATTLANKCYDNMFNGCTSLTTAPALPATTLAAYCYTSMFQGCTSLTTAPALPATTLATSCYYAMFYGCISLTTAPALPATTLAASCYLQMFQGCTSLTTAPVLPATTPATCCYKYMFRGCKSLNSVTMLVTDINAIYDDDCECLLGCLDNTASASTRTLYVDSSVMIFYTNNKSDFDIPSEWDVKKATWSVIGDFAGFNWNSDIEMTETGLDTNVFVSPAITFNAGEQFKVRYGTVWTNGDYGIVSKDNPSQAAVIELGTAVTAIAGGKNIKVSEGGNYIITLDLSDEDNPTITVTKQN